MDTDMQLLVVRGTIAGLSEIEQLRVRECARQLQATIDEYGSIGLVALVLLGAELAANGGDA